jgi:hypothetical protein
MAEIVQRIEDRICPIRKPMVSKWTVNMDPVIYEYQETERKCTRECAMFYEGFKNDKGYYCLEKDAATIHQGCRMWPEENNG